MGVRGRIGTREEWAAGRLELLALLRRCRRLSLVELFDGRAQLLVIHFMFGPDWDEGGPSCSFWADSFDGVGVHLAHRDVTLVCEGGLGWPMAWLRRHDTYE